MKVKIERRGTEFLPYENFSAKWGMWLADNAKLKNRDGVFIINYECTAANGMKKMVREFDEIEDGEYELPDKDWVIPEEGEGVRDDEW